ncbi:MAG: site-2 protease family protein [Clostridiales bacterium]|jgi:Zn-dependent protease|nr:site-2 protease family protein [Clostridiales bacterium]
MTKDFLYYLCSIPGIVLAMSLHEYVKAACASAMGDPQPKSDGRVTLNPLKQIEPIGFICMFVFGYGWSRPLDTNPFFYRDRRRGTIITYVTPSLINICVGILMVMAAGIVSECVKYWGAKPPGNSAPNLLVTTVFYLLLLAAKANISLALFQFVPVYPLNGHKLLPLALSPERAAVFVRFERPLQICLMVLLCLGAFGAIFDPVFYALAGAVR